ncbi:MAG TPA: DUF1207 domain-containing protein [Longimicrobiales bacterium]
MNTMFTRAAAGVLLVLAAAGPAAGQGFRLFEDRPTYTPFLADPRAAQINILALAYSDAFPYMQEPGGRQVWDIGLGKEIPIVGYDFGPRGAAPGWSADLVIPVSFHVIEDFKDASNPIINTDYRFSFVLRVLRGAPDFGWSQGLRVVLFGHESTHLGDEFSLAARARYPDFVRVNVSYEYSEASVMLQHTSPSWQRRVQLGVMAPVYASNHGFYSYDLRETNGRTLTLSDRTVEPYGTAELLPVRPLVGRFGFMAGLDLRPRIVYDYDRPPGVPEERQWSANLVIGLRDVERRAGETGVSDLYFRAYYGVNPAGQFRNQRDYTLIGIGLRLDI